MKKILLIGLLLTSLTSLCQIEKDTIKPTSLEEVVVTSKKLPKQKDLIPNQIESVSLKEIEFQNFQNMADVLSNSGNLHVQKSQQGGGSPSIRGFEASRVLLLVDGIRMNNLIFRSGHLQNVITVDENMLENVDIFYGPTSTLFGSDALGGSVNMTTKKVKFLKNRENKISGNINTRYSSVNEEKSGYIDINYAHKKFASLTAFSYNDFGDLRMGKQKNHNGDFFGERPFYVESNVNGVDYLVANNNKYVQKQSGYRQYNLMQKMEYHTNKGFKHGLNFQYSTTSNVPRYDRLTDVSSTTGLRNAEWYYGPQKRLLAIYSIEKEKAIFGSDLNVDIAYQNVEESRNTRKFGNPNLDQNFEKVNMYSIGLNLEKKYKKSVLFYGIESYFETLKSTATSENIITGDNNAIATRYPNGNNNMSRNDVYISYNGLNTTKWAWNVGARIGYTSLKSTLSDNNVFDLPFNTIKQENFTYSATAGLLYKTTENVALKTNISSGYRVPNIDDLAKVFDSGNGILIVPNQDLKAEKTVTTDLGFVIKSNNKRFQIENTYFYTKMFDAIVTDSFTYNGQSTIEFNGEQSAVFANQNKRKAYVTGLSTNIKTYIFENLQFHGNFNYTLGRFTEENGSKSPLDHIAPYYGKVGFLYSKKRMTAELYMLYNGKKDIEDYYLNGEDNERYAPEGGMPAWETYNLKTSILLYKNATLFAGVENILDTQYRVFASGINAPGRNFYGGIKYRF